MEYHRSRLSNRGYINNELIENEYNYRLTDGDLYIDGEKHLQLDRSPSIYFDENFRWNYIGLDFSFKIPENITAEFNTIRYSGFIKLQDELFFDKRFIKTIYVYRKKGPKRNDIFKQTVFDHVFKNVSDKAEIQDLIDSYYSVTMRASDIGKLCSEAHLQNEKSHRFTQNIRQWIARGHFESKGKEGRENTVDVSDVLNYLYNSNNQNNLESLRNFIHNDKGIIIPI